MKKVFKILLRTTLAMLVLLICLVVFLLNPQLMYAKATRLGNATFYSEQILNKRFGEVLKSAMQKVSHAEIYDSSFQYDVFVNDGSVFPSLLKKILGDGFAWGYHNSVVLNGSNDVDLKYILLNGQQRLLATTIAHEMVHCLEAKHFGLFKSRPLKNIPYWKWEGYPEYVSYKSPGENSDSILLKNLQLLNSIKFKDYYPVIIETSEGPSFAGLDYFRWWLMVKYCIDVKQMSFASILKEEIVYEKVYAEMMEWYYKTNQPGLSPPIGP